jgi:hypothetical protein
VHKETVIRRDFLLQAVLGSQSLYYTFHCTSFVASNNCVCVCVCVCVYVMDKNGKNLSLLGCDTLLVVE